VNLSLCLRQTIAPAPTLGITSSPISQAPLSRPSPLQPRKVASKPEPKSNEVVSTSSSKLELTQNASTAMQNNQMITVSPGRQSPTDYPTFNVNSTTANRACVVSGLERRKSTDSNGVTTYQGTLPTFRMVATELADLPSWHSVDAGCMVSVTHKR